MAAPSRPEKQQTQPRRRPAEIRFPFYSLADSVAVAKAIHEKGGGRATRDQLAAFLGYSTTNSGAFLGRIAAARLFELIEPEGSGFVISPLAQKILMPIHSEQVQEGHVEAFFLVPLFRAVFEEFRGKELPPEFGLKNLLRSKFGIAGRNVVIAYRTLMESADQAGFFSTRGTRTHLIIPSATQKTPTLPDSSEEKREPTGPSFGGGRGGRDDGTPPPTDPDQVRLEYVRKLISLLDNDTDLDSRKALMERIERLLGTT